MTVIVKKPKLNIMVTSVGGAIGQGILKSLKLSDINCDIIATDAYPYAVGLYTQKVGYVVPLAKDPNFIKEIIKICKKEKIHCILIGTDYELLKFAENKKIIEKATGAKVIVSSPEIIKITNDKWLTHKFFVDNNLPHIPSVLHQDVDALIKAEGFPLIIKPRIGDSSKNTHVVNNQKELQEKLPLLLDKKQDNIYLVEQSEPIIQKYLINKQEEYTSTTINFDNKCYGVISMNREMRLGGHTTKAIIENFPEINKAIQKVAETLNVFGPCNFQSRLSDGVPLIFEINCRFSGTTPFGAEVGFNAVEAIVKHVVLGERIKPLTYKKGAILRYFNEVFVPLSEIEKLKKNNYIKNPKSKINTVL